MIQNYFVFKIQINLAKKEYIIDSYSAQIFIDFIPYIAAFFITNESNLIIFLNCDDNFSSQITKEKFVKIEIIKLCTNSKIDFHFCKIKDHDNETSKSLF